MLLLRTMHCALPALFIAALVLILGCTAYDDDASSYGGSPPVPRGPIYTISQPLTIDSFISKMNPSRINALESRMVSSYYRLPFYERIPIINIQSGYQLVEQALKDFRSVVLVDPVNQEARQITLRVRNLEQIPLQDPASALLLSSLNPNVHILRRHLKHVPVDTGYPITMPDPISTDHLPHWRGIPVLTANDDTLGHMLYASKQPNEAFWHYRQDHTPVLVTPKLDNLVSEADLREKNRLNNLLTSYGAARIKYSSSAMASLLYGKEIPLDEHLNDDRIENKRKGRYNDLNQQSSRPEMIDALQRNGRFYYYDSDRSSTGPFEVKLLELEARPGEFMQINIESVARRRSIMGRLRIFRI
ncbi:uncharacterized protein SPSC_05116 [Sporisorium scitamineum]|uniref:Effector family protein Eff1 n=2 Tax=Sporisorium scitamineum TaxID=49012 RepID=A0A127ZH41_9BASI|nr:uncharacterized protein SPSC_05116 [Sporisorium scitamineum]